MRLTCVNMGATAKALVYLLLSLVLLTQYSISSDNYIPEGLSATDDHHHMIRYEDEDMDALTGKFSELEIAQARLQLANLSNRPSLRSIQSPDGDIIDCVPRDKQPAFDHPLLRNHTFRECPASKPKLAYRQAKSEEAASDNILMGISQVWHTTGIGCPRGSVPIRRARLSEILHHQRAMQAAAAAHRRRPVSSSSSSPSASSSSSAIVESLAVGSDFILGPSSEIAWAGATYVAGSDEHHKWILGSQVRLQTWGPHVEPQDYSKSLVRHVAGTGTAYDLDVVEAGWIVYPSLFANEHRNWTRFYTLWTTDYYYSTGCYNLVCPGFVQVSDKWVAGASIQDLSVYGGAIHDNIFTLWQDEEGSIWLSVNWQEMGYWPASLFRHLGRDKGADVAQFGGEVFTAMGEGGGPKVPATRTQMGSAHFPTEGWGKAACAILPAVSSSLNHSFAPLPIPSLHLAASRPGCYNADAPPANRTTVIFFGGPGESSSCIPSGF